MSKLYPGRSAGAAALTASIRSVAPDAKDAKDAAQRFEVAVSSEAEVVRGYMDFKWREVLGHEAGAVDLARFKSGRAAVLVDHSGDQVGVVESARVGLDRVLRATVRFSRNPRGQEVERDVLDGIRSNISVGYLPRSAKLVEENAEKGDLWRVTSWEPVEVSVVSVPADPSVGVGRSARAEDARMSNENVEVRTERRDVRSDAIEIVGMARANGVSERVTEWLERGATPDEVAGEILKLRASTRPPGAAPASEALDALNARERKGYSYRRALCVAAGLESGGLEGEVSRELERHMPAEAKRRGGLLLPLSLGVQHRTLTAGGSTTGAPLVFDQPGDFIELLRAKARAVEMGATVLAGLTSPISMPKQSVAGSVVWVGENPSAIAESDLNLALALLTPKTLMSATSYSRQLLGQASFDVEQLVRNDMSAIHALAIDRAAFHGLGASGEPQGLYSAVGVATVTPAAIPSFGNLINMVSAITSANGDVATMGFITTPAMAGKLAQTLVAASAGSDMLWTGPLTDGRVAGLRAVATTGMSSVMTAGGAAAGGTAHGILCGAWSELLIGLFGALEVVVDPYTSKKKGLIEVASFQMCDLVPRHGESFCKALDARIV